MVLWLWLWLRLEEEGVVVVVAFDSNIMVCGGRIPNDEAGAY